MSAPGPVDELHNAEQLERKPTRQSAAAIDEKRPLEDESDDFTEDAGGFDGHDVCVFFSASQT